MPKVSVIIPVYNAAEYMDRCIGSVTNQDFDDFEVIIVDDGSQDDSHSRALEWALEYPKIVRVFTQENAGQGAARNNGVAYADGKYIMFADSDDWVDSGFISRAYGAIVENDADIAFFDAEIVDENGRHIADMPGCHSEEKVVTLETYPELLFEAPCPWNKIYKKELFTLNNLKYPTHMWYEDLVGSSEFYCKAKKIAICHDKLYYYMQRSNSVMHSTMTSKNLEILKAVDMILDYYRSENIYGKYENELEYLAIYHVLVAAAGRTVRSDAKSPYPPQMMDYMNKRFPDWSKNTYLGRLSKANRIKLWLLSKGQYAVLHGMYKISKV
jgi:glycosyltransferase involved in cell wall biosynthesis